MGVSYKPGIADTRESPAVTVMEHLAVAGAHLTYSDPHVSSVTIETQLLGHRALDAVLEHDSPDIVVLLAAPRSIDVAAIADRVPAVFDAQGLTRGTDIAGVTRL